jgi:hypothetical protein
MRSQSSPELQATYDTLTKDDVAVASERTPSFDFAALASVAGLRNSLGEVPLDYVVPKRTEVEPTAGMDPGFMFFLLRVDGRASLKEIAQATTLSLPRTIEIYLQMLALGLVVAADDQTSGQTDLNVPPA